MLKNAQTHAVPSGHGPRTLERIIECEAYELNAVVISNRKVYADLVARLATVDGGRGCECQARVGTDASSRFQSVLRSHLLTDLEERREVHH